MNKDSDIRTFKFLSWLLRRYDIKMLVRTCKGNMFQMIPFETLRQASYNKDAVNNAWMYAFVNESKHMYKMNFNSYTELLDAIFDADEIWYVTRIFKNMFYNLRNEMLVEWDLAGNP